MAKDAKAFLLRIDPAVLAAVRKWAEDDLRSLNGQIEYLLRQAVARRGVKLPDPADAGETDADGPAPGG
ncbi:MAG: hypothetical protein K2X82_04615 [Gemmataceae bacterium]|nr:hypothetical protein [Gemmataceae bacterium]